MKQSNLILAINWPLRNALPTLEIGYLPATIFTFFTGCMISILRDHFETPTESDGYLNRGLTFKLGQALAELQKYLCLVTSLARKYQTWMEGTNTLAY